MAAHAQDMEELQRIQLTARLRAAIAVQPEIALLRHRLLEIGGLELVVPLALYPDTALLLSDGTLMARRVTVIPMQRSACHQNVARLWLETPGQLVAIATGYGLSADGLWREHSWGLRARSIVETTVPQLKYFGRRLDGTDADEFARLIL
jgi:hypothetical protein